MSAASESQVSVGWHVEVDYGRGCGWQLLGRNSSNGPQMGRGGRDHWVAHARQNNIAVRVTKVTTTITVACEVES
jgi:hypothetical protein